MRVLALQWLYIILLYFNGTCEWYFYMPFEFVNFHLNSSLLWQKFKKVTYLSIIVTKSVYFLFFLMPVTIIIAYGMSDIQYYTNVHFHYCQCPWDSRSARTSLFLLYLVTTLQWRHNACDGVFAQTFFQAQIKKIPKFRVTGFERGIHRRIPFRIGL